MHAQTDVSGDFAAVAPARHWARDRLVEAGIEDSRLEMLVLLVSELVTNAVEHAWPPVVLTVDVDDERTRVAVSDGTRAEPILRHAPPDADGGRGVWLIDLLASEWGTDVGPDGTTKTVWFELRNDDEREVLRHFAG